MQKQILKIFFLLVIFLMLPNFAMAAPIISSATGIISAGQNVTISGSGFGVSGPTVGLFDKFNNGISGTDVSLSSPSVGAWSAYNDPTHPYYNTVIPHGGNSAMQYNGGTGLRYTIPALSTEVFVSYWLRLDSDQIFPATSIANTIPSVSAWKVTWLLNGTASGFDDICIPTLYSPPAWGLGGNSNNTLPLVGTWNFRVGDLSTSSGWFKYDRWVRVSTWLKAGANPLVDNGIIWFSAENGTGREVYAKSNLPMFAGAGNHGWDHWYVGPWSNGPYASNPLFDDVYLSYGTGAVARIELCDADTFLNSNHCEIQTPTIWSDISAGIDINQGSFADGSSAYVFVIDENGTPSTGFPITFATSGDVTPPSAPTGLGIN